MARNFKELRAKLDERLDEHPDGQAIRERVRADLDAELAAYEHSLQDLRKARELTQEQLARTLGVSQAQVSRIESQADLYLSTLQSYLEAMGGELEVFGVFGDANRTRVPLTIGELRGGDAREWPNLTAALEASISAAASRAQDRERFDRAIEEVLEELTLYYTGAKVVEYEKPRRRRAKA